MSIHDSKFITTTTKIKNFKESLTPKPKPSRTLYPCADKCGALVRVKGRRCLPCKGKRF